jgi:hypothetical protein
MKNKLNMPGWARISRWERDGGRIRAAHEPMLCIPIGPESAHCIAMDPSTRTLVELLSRGVQALL